MLLASLPDEARVWLFASNRALSADEQTAALAQTRSFLREWTSHGRPVSGEVGLHHERVLVVGAHLAESELNAGVSGCGIDSLTHAVETTAARLESTPLDHRELRSSTIRRAYPVAHPSTN